MAEILLIYTFVSLPPKQRNKFRRELFGSTESSHGGKYSTTMRGFLTGKSYSKPTRSTILTVEKNIPGITKVLKKYDAIIEQFEVRRRIAK